MLSSRTLSRERNHQPLFSLGRCEVTPAATAALTTVSVDPLTLFQRHGRGDWGEVPPWAQKANGDAVRQGLCVHAIESRYRLSNGEETLLMTAPSRSHTRLLLSSEYQNRQVTSREGYALWAATYDAVPNPLIAVEQPTVDKLLAALPTAVKTAVDVGTGTGRLALSLACRGTEVVGFDQSPEMLNVARRTAQAAGLRDIGFAQASLGDGALPAASGRFDLLTCALVLCHVADLKAAIQECARLVRPGGHLLFTDFHPAAIAWGWRTAFTEPGARYSLPNPGHSREDYLRSLRDAGCVLLDVQDIALGGEPYGDSGPGAVARRGVPPLCLTILARKGTSPGASGACACDGQNEGGN